MREGVWLWFASPTTIWADSQKSDRAACQGYLHRSWSVCSTFAGNAVHWWAEKGLAFCGAGEAIEFRAANSSSWETAHARFHSISTVSSRRRLEEDHRCFVSFASLVADSEGNHGAPGALDIESTIRGNVCFADRAFASTWSCTGGRPWDIEICLLSRQVSVQVFFDQHQEEWPSRFHGSSATSRSSGLRQFAAPCCVWRRASCGNSSRDWCGFLASAKGFGENAKLCVIYIFFWVLWKPCVSLQVCCIGIRSCVLSLETSRHFKACQRWWSPEEREM